MRSTQIEASSSHTLLWSLCCPLQREGRNFFGCESFSGVPIEDVDRPGTGGVHFEQRVFNVRMLYIRIRKQMFNCACTMCNYKIISTAV